MRVGSAAVAAEIIVVVVGGLILAAIVWATSSAWKRWGPEAQGQRREARARERSAAQQAASDQRREEEARLLVEAQRAAVEKHEGHTYQEKYRNWALTNQGICPKCRQKGHLKPMPNAKQIVCLNCQWRYPKGEPL
jgi:hypothetical protein